MKLPIIIPIDKDSVCKWTFSSGLVDQTGIVYVENIEYQINNGNLLNPVLLKAYNSEGYSDIVNGSWAFNYYRKDHLGNIREVWRASYLRGGATNIPAVTIQQTQYYPSGLPWSEGIGAAMQSRKYNGKEFVEMHGYDTYDYGARGYYAASGRFMSVDPLCEKYYWISPYAYCLNNPVRFTDPDGREVDIEHRTGFLGLGKKETLKYDNGSLYNKDGSAYAGKVNGFLKKSVNALGSLSKTDEGASMVTELQSSSNVFTIKSGATNEFKPDNPSKAGANLTEVQAATGNTAGSAGSGGTIFWNSSSTSGGLDLSGGTTRPTYISLGHEMGHGSDANQGLLHFSSDYTNGMTGVQYQSTYQGLLKSEWRAVYRENLIRGQAGVSLRTNYGIDMSTGVPLPAGPRLLDSSNQSLNYP